MDEVVAIINSLKNTSSIGPDNIFTRILKLAVSIVSKPLAFLINLSITFIKFPTIVKINRIKISDNLTNFQTISILRVSSKIFGKMVSDNQHNFRQGSQQLQN